MSNARAVETRNPGIPWWLLLIEGAAAIIIGILLFMRPAATTIILIQFLGIFWLITGIFSIISLIWDRSAWGWKLLSGILGILAGILISQNPLWSTLLVPTSLAIVLGVFGIMIGIVQLIDAFRGGGWGIGILGALSILLGIVLITRPVIAGLTLPWVLGGLLIFGGILAIVAAFGLRSIENEIKEKQARAARASTAAAIPVTGSPAVQTPTAGTRSQTLGATSTAGSTAGTAAASTAAVAAAGFAAAKTTGEGVSEQPSEVVASPTVESTGEAREDSAMEAFTAAAAVGDQVTGSVDEEGEAASSFASDIPEAVLSGNIDPADPEEMAKFKYALEYVEGIGPVYAGKLKEVGLLTCLDLLKAGASRKGREEIALQADITGSLILKWVNHVDLYRIKGVGTEYADLLEAAGVDTVMELAQRNPANLYEKVTSINAEKSLVRRPPTAAQVDDWISQAKNLPRVVTY